MRNRAQEDSKEKMGKKEDPKEIPVEFFDGSEKASSDDEAATAESAAPEGAQHSPGPDLQAQVDALTQEKTALYDQMLRRQAEFENYRRRVEREKAEFHARARGEVLLELLPVVDNFERALSSLQKKEADAAGLRHGLELIHKQLKDALTKFGLEPLESVGQVFDPHFHEAVTIEPTDEHEENTIIEEFQRGYKLGEKLLRPAKVKVAASPNR
ncbi:MAG TPA: nucleotide exchange factor GrpE [Blastocatellia bacterium]|nr:nucleotide exchange factor GrpE [Blastocatellia bacterium]